MAEDGLCRVQRRSSARIPNRNGTFSLVLYRSDRDEKEHLAFVMGEVVGRRDVLVRVHSECFTGDVLGSQRCDCGPQLDLALDRIAEEGQGVVVYLRQEGRGIGLEQKLRAYALQDLGFDTVDANLMLGHEADERDYCVAARILEDLGVVSARLMTNNPAKIEDLRRFGIDVSARVALETPLHPENSFYLATKMRRMRHLLDLEDERPRGTLSASTATGDGYDDPAEMPAPPAPGSANGNGHALGPRHAKRPVVTLSYAQSLDGCIAARRGEPFALSGDLSLTETHRLRAAHDGILVGIGTVLSDDPRLSVRLVEGRHPRPIVLDSGLRTPPDARLFRHAKRPIIATTEGAPSSHERRLVEAGAEVIRLTRRADGWVSLEALLEALKLREIDRLMVEGGARVITSFLTEQLVDQVVITVAPMLLGGLQAISDAPLHRIALPKLEAVSHQVVGRDVMMTGRPVWT